MLLDYKYKELDKMLKKDNNKLIVFVGYEINDSSVIEQADIGFQWEE